MQIKRRIKIEDLKCITIAKLSDEFIIHGNENEYDYLLIMDQDSYWDDLSNYFGWTIYNSQAPEGIWGPEVIERQRENPVIQVNKVITSGMLVNLNLINKIGGWNEIFDIDCVDDEFCLRARQYGINTYLFSKCRLRHRFGEPKSVEILGHRGLLRNDPPQRLYSIYRNHIILMKLFPLERSLKTEFKEDWIDRIKWILIFEDKRLKKMIAIVRGIISGMFY